MANIGGVQFSDDELQRLSRGTSRPGLGDFLAAGASSAYGALRYGLPYAVEKAAGTASKADDQYYQAWLQRNAEDSAALAPGGPAGVSDVFAGRAGVLDLIGENLAYSAPQMAAVLAGGLGGALAGGPGGALAGATAVGTPLFVGTNTSRAIDDGEFTQDEAARSIGVAPLQAAADALVGRFLPGAGKILGKAAATSAAPSFVRRTAASVVKAGLTEGVTEAGQQVGERFAAGMPLDNREAAQEIIETFGTSALVGGALGIGGGVSGGPAQQVKTSDPNALGTEDINAAVDQMLGVTTTVAEPKGFRGAPLVDDSQGPQADLRGSTQAARQPVSPFGADLRPPVPPGLSAGAFDNSLLGQEGVVARVGVAPPSEQITYQPEVDVARPDLTVALQNNNDALVDNQIDPVLVELQSQPTGDLYTVLERTDDPVITRVVNEELQRRAPEATEGRLFDVRKAQTAKGLSKALRTQVEGAQNADELVQRVNDYVVNEAKGGEIGKRRAQDLGLLDAEGKPTDLSREITARTNPEAAIRAERSVEFQGELDTLQEFVGRVRAPSGSNKERRKEDQILKGIFGTVRSAEDLDQQLLAAVAVDPVEATRPALPETWSRIEKLAIKRGIINNKLELTETGRAIAARTALPTEEIVTVAQDQGYTGAKASQFERGVRAFQAGKTKVSSTTGAAYRAGKAWAEQNLVPQVATAAQTEEVLGRIGRGVPTEQQLRQWFNNVVSEQSSELPGLATLKTMVRDGAPMDQLIETYKQVKAGRGFVQPERDLSYVIERYMAAEAARTGVPDAGSGFERTVRRHQLRTVRRVNQELTEQELTRGSARQEQRDETYQILKDSIGEAQDRGEITRADAMVLIGRLRQGNYKGALAGLPGTVNVEPAARVDARAKSEIPLPAGVLQESRVADALAWVGRNSTIPFHRVLAKRLERLVGDTPMIVMGPQQQRQKIPNSGYEARAVHGMVVHLDGDVKLYISDTGDSATTGATEATLLHEAIHAALAVKFGNLKGIATKALNSLQGVGREGRALIAVMQNAAKAWDQMTPAQQQQLSSATRAEMKIAFNNVDEFLTYSLTNPEFAVWLDSVDSRGVMVDASTPSLWQQFVDFVRRVLGLPSRLQPDLQVILEAGTLLNQVDAASTALFDRLEQVDGFQPGIAKFRQVKQLEAKARSAQSINDRFKEAVQNTSERVRNTDWRGASRRLSLGWRSLLAIADQYRNVPGVQQYADAQLERQATQAQFAQLAQQVMRPYHRLEQSAPKMAEKIGLLMEYTRLQIDPRKTWADHTHLHGAKNEAMLKRQVREANNMYQDVRQKGHADIYNGFITLNEMMYYAGATTALGNMSRSNVELANKLQGLPDPSTRFRETRETQTSPTQARDFWRKQLKDHLDAVDKVIADTRGTGVSAGLERHLNAVEAQARMIRNQQQNIGQAPYFHLGRQGDYFVTFQIKTAKNGEVDPKAALEVAKAFSEAGFDDVRLSADNTNPAARLSLETRSAREKAFKVTQELQRKGLLSDAKAPARGTRDAATAAAFFGANTEQLNRFIEAVETDPSFDTSSLAKNDPQRAQLNAIKEGIISHARQIWLNQTPDTSLAKVLVERLGVQGYSTNMVRNFAHRFQLSSNAVAGMAASSKVSGAISSMRDQKNQAEQDPDGSPDLYQDLLDEVLLREYNHTVRDQEVTGADKLRAISHAYFLGMSPSYAAINMTQLGVLLWPELAKRGGFIKAAKAISKVTPVAFKVLRATLAASRAEGWKHLGDISITPEIMERAGVDAETADFVLKMAATGVIDLGSAARELGQIAEQGDQGYALKLASTLGMYSETFTRLVAALSAREVSTGGQQETLKYAQKVVNESMLNYAQSITARQLGKDGRLGEYTPIVTQFLQYSAQVLDKLYREVMDAAWAADPKRKSEARKFLAGHLTAVTALAGTLGLPLVTVAAGALEKLVDAFDDDDEPYDATAAYRNFLASVFGPGVAEVVARGLPRAVGFDISGRVGEQDILPFSQLFTDRREWSEAIDSFIAGRAVGASGGMVEGLVTGATKIARGDVLGGMAAAFPLALRGPANALVMSQDGFKDSRGNVLPISPTATAYLAQILGFNPAIKAEYSEQRLDQSARESTLTQQSRRLRNGIVDALLKGDREKARELVREARKFDEDVPEYAVLPDISNAMQRRIRLRATAQAIGQPLGVGIDDEAARRLTSYANY